MALDPQARTLLDQMAAATERPLWEYDVTEARALFKAGRGLGRTVAAPIDTEDRTIPGPRGPIPVRIYRPATNPPHRATEPGAELPLLVYFHGGGFVFGDLNTHDPLCRQFAAAVPAVVVSVDYRLAPEHRFPAAVDDAEAATVWAAEQAATLGADARSLTVAGDSAGGTLAAVVARRARDGGGPAIALQLLIYPATDLTRTQPSHQSNGEGYFLTSQAMRWFTANYLGDDALVDLALCRQPDASPLFAADLTGLPPAHVVTAEFDPLRDEGEAYAGRLQEAGVPTTLVRYDGMIHGFVSMDAVLDAGARAVDDLVAAVTTATTP
jgi:acetyl esterase